MGNKIQNQLGEKLKKIDTKSLNIKMKKDIKKSYSDFFVQPISNENKKT